MHQKIVFILAWSLIEEKQKTLPQELLAWRIPGLRNLKPGNWQQVVLDFKH